MASPLSSAGKRKGTAFETLTVRYLARHVDERIERRARYGAKDRGDVAGLRALGQRVVGECKNVAVLALAAWAGEAEDERRNDDAVAAVVIHKRVGHGDPGDQWVTMTLRDLAALLTGQRPTD